MFRSESSSEENKLAIFKCKNYFAIFCGPEHQILLVFCYLKNSNYFFGQNDTKLSEVKNNNKTAFI